MDVEESQVEFELTPAPDEQNQQELVALFDPFPFTHETRDHILTRRSVMSDELVFDLLLEQASIASPQSLYPPESPGSLLQLLDAIANCPWDALKKSCLQFYLLSHVSPGVAARHAISCALPPQFVHLAHACFLLDSGSLEDMTRAVALLSDARIVQDLSSKILQTISLAPQPHSSRLVRTYVRTSQPVIEEYEDLAIYLRALLEYNLADAWSFQRSFSEITPIRNQLIRTVLDSCLIPLKPSVLTQFLSLPLTFFEFSLLQSYALAPPEELSAAAHAILQDLITVRLLHSGKYSDAIHISRSFDTLNAKSRSITATPLHKAAEERQQMMRDILAVVPEVQRRQLELELNDEQRDLSASSPSASWMSVGNDISMSWESVGSTVSAKAREKAAGGVCSGRLEGSPTPTLPSRPHISTPFGPFIPASSVQKRKASTNGIAYSSVNTLGTRANEASVFPKIPTRGLATSSSTVTPSLSGFGSHQTSHLSFTPLSHRLHRSQNRNGEGLPLGTGPARKAYNEPQSSHPDPSNFVRRGQNNNTSGPFAIPTGCVNSEMSASGAHVQITSMNKNSETETQGSQLGESEDIMMMDSDDPDGFVVHGRRRILIHLPVQNGATHTSEDVSQSGVDGARSPFHQGTSAVQRSDEGKFKREARVLPGGFTSMEPPESTSAPSASERATKEPATPHNERTASQMHEHPSNANTQSHPMSSRIKIPGALFEEDADADEEQDQVFSLPPVPVKGGGRKRTSRAGSVITSSEEDDRLHTPLRRSSRLSSTGTSPETTSPKRPGKKIGSRKMTTKSTQDGTSRRKRKNAEG